MAAASDSHPSRPIRIGTQYGGFYYPRDLTSHLGPESFVVCAGAGEDILHDVTLAALTGATVHIVDPTPRAVAHVERVRRVLRGEEPVPRPDKRCGGGDPNYWRNVAAQAAGIGGKALAERIVLHPVALGSTCGRAAFYPPDNPAHVSHSLVRGMTSAARPALMVDVLSFEAFCARVGRRPSEIALLKLDVEGAELDILEGMLADAHARPRYLTVEFDRGWRGKEGTRDRPACDRMIARLQSEEGYTLLHISGADHSFVRAS